MLLNTLSQRVRLGCLLLMMIGLTACGGTATATDGAGTTTGADAAGTGDEPNVVYTAPGGAFHFSHPQSWTQTTPAGETIRFTGRDEFISVTVVSTTLSPADYATQDNAALVKASPGFAGKAPVTVKINAGASAIVAYQWNAGPSAVTGKLVPSSANRLYIPGPNGTLAVYTYSAPNQTYDPAGAVDFVNTFGWQ